MTNNPFEDFRRQLDALVHARALLAMLKTRTKDHPNEDSDFMACLLDNFVMLTIVEVAPPGRRLAALDAMFTRVRTTVHDAGIQMFETADSIDDDERQG